MKLTSLIDAGIVKKVELSRNAGISRVALNRYLSNQQCPTLDVLDKLSSALALPASGLIDGGSPVDIETAEVALRFTALNEMQREFFLVQLRAMVGTSHTDKRKAK